MRGGTERRIFFLGVFGTGSLKNPCFRRRGRPARPARPDADQEQVFFEFSYSLLNSSCFLGVGAMQHLRSLRKEVFVCVASLTLIRAAFALSRVACVKMSEATGAIFEENVFKTL